MADYRWVPVYKMAFDSRWGEEEKMVPIETIYSTECPMSVIIRNPGIANLVVKIQDAEFLRNTTTAIEYGRDPGRWPAIWQDAVKQAEMEQIRVSEARDKARPK